MAESALSLGYPEISVEVAEFLGYGRTSGNWTTDQTSHITSAMDAGLRRFLNPLDRRTNRAYSWSFLQSTGTVTTADDDAEYDLADDFGTMRGEMTFSADSGYAPPMQIGESEIRTLQSQSDQSGHPEYYAIRRKTFDGTGGQRSEVVFYPEPDGVYTLTYAYYVLADTQLRSGTPYPLGGMVHAETILSACLMMAERQRKTEIGVWAEDYAERLQASIEYDKKQWPRFLGKALDHSDDAGYMSRNYYVTVNGVQPS